jgi:predicted RNA-binding Zn-ribbon protein involved in translation (DUF1610 family)
MLSCSCEDWDFEWWYERPPEDFEKFERCARRKRCISCGKLIDFESDCIKFDCYRSPYNWVEENIHGDAVPIAPRFMCESCGEIFLNLSALGYCLTIGHHIKEDLEDYWDLTGFKPK